MSRAQQLIEQVMNGVDPVSLLSEADKAPKAADLLAAIEKQLDTHLKSSITKRKGFSGPGREVAELHGKYRMLTGAFRVDVIKLFGESPEFEITVEAATTQTKKFTEKNVTAQSMQSIAKKIADFINKNIPAK
jgi:aminoglycoside phosphotransferase family enzyme